MGHVAEVLAAEALGNPRLFRDRVTGNDDWAHCYTREQAAFPVHPLKLTKVWPAVGRVDNAYGDRNGMCSCLPVEAYQDA